MSCVQCRYSIFGKQAHTVWEGKANIECRVVDVATTTVSETVVSK